jgi:hypothetical protein
MKVFRILARGAATTVIVALVLLLALLNARLYQPGRVTTSMTQLQFIKQSLNEGGAERMQQLFPEGYLFTWALYGLTSANVARSLPPHDPRRAEALRAAREAITHVDSAPARATFIKDMTPNYGVFYASWSLYLRSAVLRASGPADPVPFDRKQFERDCDALALALAQSDSPFLASFPGAVWPVDTSVGIAALAIADPYLEHRYRPLITKWVAQARQHRDVPSGALSHMASLGGDPMGVPRGGSLAMMSYVLADVDPAFARQQYDALRKHFVDYRWGMPGVREYPHGVDGAADVDSGPIMLGFTGPASVLGAGAAIANGDDTLATTLLATVEVVGMPFERDGQRRYAGGYLPVGDAFLAWARSVPPASPAHTFGAAVPDWWRLLLHALSLVFGAAAVFALVKINARKNN